MYVLTVKTASGTDTFNFESDDDAFAFFEEGVANGDWEADDYMSVELDNDMF